MDFFLKKYCLSPLGYTRIKHTPWWGWKEVIEAQPQSYWISWIVMTSRWKYIQPQYVVIQYWDNRVLDQNWVLRCPRSSYSIEVSGLRLSVGLLLNGLNVARVCLCYNPRLKKLQIWAILLVESKLLNPRYLHNGPSLKYENWSDDNMAPFSSQILLETRPS